MEKKKGFGKSIFPMGKVKLRDSYRFDGEIFDTSTKYYSTGKIKEKNFIKNGK